MKHRVVADFEYVLGQERWHKVGSELSIFGVDFAVEFVQDGKFEIDTNGDGNLNDDVQGASGLVDLKGKDEDGNVFHYGVRFKKDGARKYSWASSGAMVGKVEGSSLFLIDANANGSYGDFGIDAVVIGNGRNAGYLSKVINIGGKLFDVDVSNDGTSFKTKRYVGETGMLKLGKLKGVHAKPVAAILKMNASISFEFAGASKGLLVPTGGYTLASAFLERGPETARVRGRNMRPVIVEDGGEAQLTWGGPLEGTMAMPTVADTTATIRPTIQITGTAGEEYYDFLPKGKAPTYELFDAETEKRLAKGTFPAG